jgi:hypothetical protein
MPRCDDVLGHHGAGDPGEGDVGPAPGEGPPSERDLGDVADAGDADAVDQRARQQRQTMSLRRERPRALGRASTSPCHVRALQTLEAALAAAATSIRPGAADPSALTTPAQSMRTAATASRDARTAHRAPARAARPVTRGGETGRGVTSGPRSSEPGAASGRGVARNHPIVTRT